MMPRATESVGSERVARCSLALLILDHHDLVPAS